MEAASAFRQGAMPWRARLDVEMAAAQRPRSAHRDWNPRRFLPHRPDDGSAPAPAPAPPSGGKGAVVSWEGSRQLRPQATGRERDDISWSPLCLPFLAFFRRIVASRRLPAQESSRQCAHPPSLFPDLHRTRVPTDAQKISESARGTSNETSPSRRKTEDRSPGPGVTRRPRTDGLVAPTCRSRPSCRQLAVRDHLLEQRHGLECPRPGFLVRLLPALHAREAGVVANVIAQRDGPHGCPGRGAWPCRRPRAWRRRAPPARCPAHVRHQEAVDDEARRVAALDGHRPSRGRSRARRRCERARLRQR